MKRILTSALLWAASAATAMGACVISKISELPVTTRGRQVIVESRINGQPVRALLDTGAYMTSIGTEAAKRLGLTTEVAEHVHVYGVGGQVRAFETQLQSLEIGMFTGHRVLIAVLDDGSRAQEIGFDMILGMDLLSRFTLEMDLANGVVRFLKPEGCKPEQLVYWAKSWSEVEIHALNSNSPHIEFTALLNGVKTDAELDTGAATSVATSYAARRAGIPRDSYSAKATQASRGLNGKLVDTWLVMIDAFSIGDDETIRNVQLRVGDLFGSDTYLPIGSHIPRQIEHPELFVGHDFMMAHHAIILFNEHKMFLTYNGGPVFQTRPQRSETAAARPDSASE